jgi:hypothetical protein
MCLLSLRFFSSICDLRVLNAVSVSGDLTRCAMLILLDCERTKLGRDDHTIYKNTLVKALNANHVLHV